MKKIVLTLSLILALFFSNTAKASTLNDNSYEQNKVEQVIVQNSSDYIKDYPKNFENEKIKVIVKVTVDGNGHVKVTIIIKF